MFHKSEFSVNNQLKIVENFIKSFENNFNNKDLDLQIHFNVNCGYERCMARIWDLKGDSIPDINKRCVRAACALGLCNIHLRRNPHGRVDEYPSELKLTTYRNKDKNIDEKINLSHNHYYIFKSKSYNKKKVNLNLKKINNYNSKMSLEKIDYRKTLDTTDKETLSHEDIAKIITQSYGIKNLISLKYLNIR